MSLLRMRNVVGGHSGQSALDGVDLDIRAGEVMGLAGGSGCGKSVLIDILSGELEPRSGAVARVAGVRVVRDPSSVAMDLSIAENVFAGIEPRNRFRLISRKEMGRRTQGLLDVLGLRLDPWLPVRRLSPVLRCAIQAVSGLATGARVVVFDGLSDTMPEDELMGLRPVVSKLAEAGVAVLYASRCVRELNEVCDRITVLRDGRTSGPFGAGEVCPELLTERTAGTARFARRDRHDGDEPVLEVRGLRSGSDVLDVSFRVAGGEIVALVGAGRTTVGRVLFGAAPLHAGEIRLHGEPVRLRHPQDAVRAGIGYLAGDQELSGLAPGRTVGGNLGLLAPLADWSSESTQRRLVKNAQTLLGVRYPSPEVPVDRLSTGEQRKLGLARWLTAESEVLVLDEPGGAMDSQGRAEIHWMIRTLAAAGVAVVVITSDIDEVLDLADRVVVLRAGRGATHATEDDVVTMVTGVDPRSVS